MDRIALLDNYRTGSAGRGRAPQRPRQAPGPVFAHNVLVERGAHGAGRRIGGCAVFAHDVLVERGAHGAGRRSRGGGVLAQDVRPEGSGRVENAADRSPVANHPVAANASAAPSTNAMRAPAPSARIRPIETLVETVVAVACMVRTPFQL